MKQFPPSEVTLLGIVTLRSEEQPVKQFPPSEVTLLGIVTLCSEEQFVKQLETSEVTLRGIVTLCSEWQFVKQFPPSEVTLLDIYISTAFNVILLLKLATLLHAVPSGLNPIILPPILEGKLYVPLLHAIAMSYLPLAE